MKKGLLIWLGDAAYLDVLAYILQQNSFPAGTEELKPDVVLLKGIQIVASPVNSHEAHERAKKNPCTRRPSCLRDLRGYAGRRDCGKYNGPRDCR
jgi:hypothetical protein